MKAPFSVQRQSLWITLSLILLLAQGAFASLLVVGLPSDLISPDPAIAPSDPVSRLVHELLFIPLFTVESGAIAPGLAHAIDASSLTEWVITLTPGGRVSASQLAQALRHLYLPSDSSAYAPPSYDLLPVVQDIQPIGDSRVRIKLSEPYPSIPIVLSQAFVTIPYGDRPVGTGMYDLEHWSHGNRVRLVKKDNTAKGPDSVIFEVIPGLTRRLMRLESGDLDVLPFLPVSSTGRVRSMGDVEIVSVPGTRSLFIEVNTTRPPFADPLVRRALNLAIDLQAMVEEVYEGFGYPTATILAPTTLGFNPDLSAASRDRDKARQLLLEAGYPHGFDFELDVLAERLPEARVLARMWEDLGVTVHLRVWPNWSTLKAALLRGDRVAWTGEWNNTSRDPASILHAKVRTGGSANYGGYSNPQVDALLRQAEQTVGWWDRLELYDQVQDVLLADAAMLATYTEANLTARRVDVAWTP